MMGTDRLRRLSQSLGDIPTGILTWFFSDTASLYDVLGTQPGVGNYLNLGWWTHEYEPSELTEEIITEACRELVRQLASFGRIEPEDRILDVGFGFGQQDVLLAEEFGCREITGVNITGHHVRRGREIVKEHDQEDRISLHQGDAVNLPFDENSFDTVFALESAFHFRTREDFFEEAHRVLEPGGTLITADIIDGSGRARSPVIADGLARAHEAYWNIPEENRIELEGYEQTLERTGFDPLELRDVSEHVLQPWVHHYLPWRLQRQPAPVRWLGPPLLHLLDNLYTGDTFAYVFTRSQA